GPHRRRRAAGRPPAPLPAPPPAGAAGPTPPCHHRSRSPARVLDPIGGKPLEDLHFLLELLDPLTQLGRLRPIRPLLLGHRGRVIALFDPQTQAHIIHTKLALHLRNRLARPTPQRHRVTLELLRIPALPRPTRPTSHPNILLHLPTRGDVRPSGGGSVNRSVSPLPGGTSTLTSA